MAGMEAEHIIDEKSVTENQRNPTKQRVSKSPELAAKQKGGEVSENF